MPVTMLDAEDTEIKRLSMPFEELPIQQGNKYIYSNYSFFLIFIVIQLQLSAFSPHPSTPPQPNPPPSPHSLPHLHPPP